MKHAKAPELNVRLLQETTCPSLSARSLLTYQIGCTEDSAIQIRVHQNTGKGYFSREWIPFAAVDHILRTVPALTANAFRSIYEGKSVNTAGFLMAVLKHLELIKPLNGNQRCYGHTTSEAFIAEITALMTSPVALVAVPAESQAKKGTLKAKPKKP